jgi:hypothetical protein
MSEEPAMSAPSWATPIGFEGLDLQLSDLDVMADLDPDWIGWAAEAIAAAATEKGTS